MYILPSLEEYLQSFFNDNEDEAKNKKENLIS